METEIISKRTRNEFREFLVGWTLREIEMEFEGADISCDRQFSPQIGGQRREFVEQHYHTLDFANPKHLRKILCFYGNVLNKATSNLSASADKSITERAINNLIFCLKADGFEYRNEKIQAIHPELQEIIEEPHAISEVTRRGIFDEIRGKWSGEIGEVDFLSRLYPLNDLPSFDPRFNSAKGDIYQHRINNPSDWDDGWILSDSRFELLKASDAKFLKFLSETIHPIVRPDLDEVNAFLSLCNKYLRVDGWELARKGEISGKPIFAGRPCLTGAPALAAAKPVEDALNADYVSKQISRMERSINADPELAIGTAKEFLETICKTILLKCGQTVPSGLELPKLVRQVCKELRLLPDNITDSAKGSEIIKRTLSNLASVAQGLAEIRGLYGSGHGKHAHVSGLHSRHAKLAIGAATTLAVFLFETHQERSLQNISKPESD